MSGLLQVDGLAAARLPSRPLHLAIGIFDGVHLGHQSVIEAAIHSARRSNGLAGVLTFAPHPSVLLRPANPTLLLMPPEMKRILLGRLGVDVLIVQAFTHEYAAVNAEEFVPQLRAHLPELAAVYVGENWRFGRDRRGDVSVLVAEAGKVGLSVFSVPRLNHNGSPISSSRIRELLAAGDMGSVNAMLGYTYFSVGPVERGKQLGRTLGFPTLNLVWMPELRPRFGVYVVEVAKADGTLLQGVANYGVRPTVGAAAEPRLEVHVLAPPAPDYGETVTVNWLHFLRPERKFGSLDALRLQIEIDREGARSYFAGTNAGETPNDA